MEQPTTKQIAALLRSTDDMANQFVLRVQARVGEPVSPDLILAAMEKIPTKSLSFEKVVLKTQQQQKSVQRRSSRRQSTRSKSSNAGAEAPVSPTVSPVPDTPSKEPKTVLEQLDSVLAENWNRAEAEGLQPDRMTAEAFVDAVYQYTDRREGTRRRILQAARQLDHNDTMLTPALVADVVHTIFEG
jgi:hypothetical protein